MAEPWITLHEDPGPFFTVVHLHELKGGRGNRMIFRLDPDAEVVETPTAMMSLARRGPATKVDGVTMGPTFVSRKVHPAPPEKPTTWLIEEDLEPDVVEAHVRWEWRTKDGTPFEHEKVVSLVNKKAYNADAPVKRDLGSLAAPRLVVGINGEAVETPAVPAGASFDLPAPDKTGARPPLGPEHLAGLELILKTIAERLDEGFDGLWTKIDPRYPDLERLEQEAKERETKDLSRQQLDELWARRVTEMLALIPYSGPGLVYTYETSDSKLGKVELPLLTKVLDDADPAYPLVCACQHLATLGWTTRGIAWTSKVTLNAGSETLHTIRDDLKGTYFLKPGAPYTGAARPLSALGKNCSDFIGNNAADGALKVPGFGPGSVLVWANKAASTPVDEKARTDAGGHPVIEFNNDLTPTPEGATSTKQWHRVDNRSAAHIAFVLRRDFPRGTVQFFDTGGAGQLNERVEGVSAYRPQGFPFGGNFDDPSLRKIAGSGDPCRGLGVPPPVSDETLEKAVERLSRARPLGFAKLVLLDRSVKPVQGQPPAAAYLYVSPWLRMHRHGQPTKNYAISRLAWSLRGLPGRERIEARWIIETPVGKTTDALMAHGRELTLSGLAELPGVAKPPKAGSKPKPYKTVTTRRIMELKNVATTDTVQVSFRRSSTDGTIGTRMILNFNFELQHAPEGLKVPDYFAQEGAAVMTTSE